MSTINVSLSSYEEKEMSSIVVQTLPTPSTDLKNIESELSLFDDALAKLVSLTIEEEFEAPKSLEEQAEQELNISQIGVHPLISEDRNNALLQLAELLSAADLMISELQTNPADTICPYQATLQQYLGPEFKPLNIHEITIPSDFSLTKASENIKLYREHIDNKMIAQLDKMLEEATDTAFPGITSQHIGNAFAVLSTTATGTEWVIDEQKLAKHLEFAELVRNMPTDYMDLNEANPLIVSLKLIAQYESITKT